MHAACAKVSTARRQVKQWLEVVVGHPVSESLCHWLESRVGVIDPEVTLSASGLDSMDIMTLKLRLKAEDPRASLVQLDTAALEGRTWGELETLAEESKATTERKFGFSPTVLASEVLEREENASAGVQYRVGGISACAAGDLERLQEWVAQGWQPQRAVDKNGSNGLMWAAGGGHAHICEFLLGLGVVDVEAKNKKGRTALMQASS